MTIETVTVTLAAPPGVQVIATQPQRQEVSPSVFLACQSEWPDSFVGNLVFLPQVNYNQLGSTELSHEDSQKLRTDGEGFDREGPCEELAVATAAMAAVVRQVRDICIPRKRGKWSNYRNALEAFLASESGDTAKIAFLTGKTIDETRLELQGLEVAGLIKAEIGSRSDPVYSLVRSAEN